MSENGEKKNTINEKIRIKSNKFEKISISEKNIRKQEL